MVKLLLLDNYDSFTYNLYDYIKQSDDTIQVDVFRNDKISLTKAEEYDLFVLSPGPGLPAESGILGPLIRNIHNRKPILGVCLGLQAIVENYGGTLVNLSQVLHGVARDIYITDPKDILYQSLPTQFKVGRYHSWVANPLDFPGDLIITAVDADRQIMSIRHRKYPVFGVQYHPESILTPHGLKIITNFLSYAGLYCRQSV